MRLIFQNYNDDESIYKVLRNSFEDESYTHFIAFIAFASEAGTSLLNDMLLNVRSRFKEIKIFLGVDRNGTSTEALKTLLESDIDVKIVYTTSGPIFHPKIYTFYGSSKVRLIIGSSNLTNPGLFNNIEASAILDFDSDELGDGAMTNTFKSLTESPETLFGKNQQKLDTKLIDLLESVGIVKSEKDRVGIDAKFTIDNEYLEGTKIKESWMNINNLFPPLKKKQSVTMKKKNQKDIHKTKIHQKTVLVAEIPRGQNRWNQANFDIDTFKNFFGLTPGAQEGLTLIPVFDNGKFGTPENRRNVSVKSHNYRIELGMAAHIPYPNSGRPICVFLKIDNFKFHYRLFLPNDKDYSKLISLLDQYSRNGKETIRRISFTLSEFSNKLQNIII